MIIFDRGFVQITGVGALLVTGAMVAWLYKRTSDHQKDIQFLKHWTKYHQHSINETTHTGQGWVKPEHDASSLFGFSTSGM